MGGQRSTHGWQGELTPEQQKVLWDKGTEAPFSGAYVHTQKKGRYRCVSCGAELFSSDAKFDSGTGWPSFDQALPGATILHADPEDFMHRTEVVCAKCGGHLGHVFDDLPAQTGGPLRQDGKPAQRRYCINSVCIDLDTEK